MEKLGVVSKEMIKMKRSMLTISVIAVITLSMLAMIPIPVKATTETRYLRSDMHTVNGLYTYVLGTSISNSPTYQKLSRSGFHVVYWGIRVYVRHSYGTETEITSGTPVGVVQRSYSGYGIQSASWTCPTISLARTDALVIRVYTKFGSNDWGIVGTWITERLGKTRLDSSAWTVYYYTRRQYTSGVTYGYFYFDRSSDFNSRITNINTVNQPSGPITDYLNVKICLNKVTARVPPIPITLVPGFKVGGLTGSYSSWVGILEYDFENGEIDIIDSSLDKTWIDKWVNNPDIQLRDYDDIGKWQFDLNNQKWPTGCDDHKEYDPATGTYKTYFDPNCPWCIKAREFRKALAYLTDKDRYVTDVMKGYGLRMDTMVPVPALEYWTDYSSLESKGLIYHYNVETAKNILDNAGFTVGSDKKTRIDPKTGAYLNPLIFYAPLDDQYLSQAAQLLQQQLQAVGIPVSMKWYLSEVIYTMIAANGYNYNIATSGYTSGPCEDVYYIHDLYHSKYYWGPDTNYSPNYQGFCNRDFDSKTEQIKYGTSREVVRQAAIEAQEIYAENVPVIDLWCLIGVKAYRTGWEGAVNMYGRGVDNYFGFVNMYRSGVNTVNWGFSYSIPSLHVICGIHAERKILELIHESLIVPNPYNLQEDCGLLAESWSTGTWSGGMTVTFTLRNGIKWHDGTDLTPEDVKFSIKFTKDCGFWAMNNPLLSDLDHVNIQSDEPALRLDQVKVYFSKSSYWALHWAGFIPIISKKIWMAANTKYGWGYGTGSWDPSKVFAYRPWEQDGDDNGKVDLKDDGTGPWIFLSKDNYYIYLQANREFYRTQEEISGYIETAFHKLGNVNYDGAYFESYYRSTVGIDRVIDTKDMNLIAKAYGTDKSWPWGTAWNQYNPDADLNNDGLVDVTDLGIAGINYGKFAG